MAAEPLTMEKIRIIIQQKANGASIRSIVRNTGISRNTVRQYLRLLKQGGYNLKQALDLDDEQLAQICLKQVSILSKSSKYNQLSGKLPEYSRALNKRHVTRQLLWEEYRQEFPEGYGYTQFCHYLNLYQGTQTVTAMFTHTPGHKLMVDFAGDKLSYIDKKTGEIIWCQVLVTILPYSNYIYAESLPSQTQESFLTGLNNAFVYMGGVPQSVLCDNLKSAVKKANRYEPTFTELIEQVGLHYQTTFMATRVRKPKDKASVESAVRIVYQRIYAKLRDQHFYSLKELNNAIHQRLISLNQRMLKGRDYSRFDLFKKDEQPVLKPLPCELIEIKKSVFAKVQKNYHIILGQDMHQYSVPYRYTGKKVKVIYTSDWVEIYSGHNRIAAHGRNYRKHGYTTLKEHMPENHKAVYRQKGWDAGWFIKQGHAKGINTGLAIERVLESKAFPEQTYNACLGILRLDNKYGTARLEKACGMALDFPRINYGIINNILSNNMDKLKEQQANLDFKTPEHNNLRGPENYN